MARVPYLDKSDMPPEHGDLPVSASNISRALANSPNGGRQIRGLAMSIRHNSVLDPRLRELAILQVGYATRSEYEYAHHVELALGVGVPEGDIRAIAEETAGRASALDPLARAVLRAAREMTFDLAVSDDTFAVLSEHLDHERLVDLMIAIATYNAVVRLLASLKIDLEDEYRQYLARFPLPG